MPCTSPRRHFESNSKAQILFSHLRCTPDSHEEIQISPGNRTSSCTETKEETKEETTRGSLDSLVLTKI